MLRLPKRHVKKKMMFKGGKMSKSIKDALPKLRRATQGVLRRGGITTVWALTRWTPEQLLKIRGMGGQRVAEIQKRLSEKGLTLRRPG
jgi:DNA-directed RNA polymerase alpha subunit